MSESLPTNLQKRNILLGITGGIAAYKAAELVRGLVKSSAEVRVVMTEAATAFITPMTLQALSGNPVRVGLFDEAHEAAMGHIELARWAELIVVAPASADFLARLNAGMANDLLATLCLATTAPIAVAPAMNQQMWQAQVTGENIETLRGRGVQIWGPAEGEQACGGVGPEVFVASAVPVLVSESVGAVALPALCPVFVTLIVMLIVEALGIELGEAVIDSTEKDAGRFT